VLWGCGGDSSSSGADAGRLTVAVTDAPVDAAEAVFLSFAEIALHGVEGSEDQGPFTVAEMVDFWKFAFSVDSVVPCKRLCKFGRPVSSLHLRLVYDLVSMQNLRHQDIRIT
jgi:hypothetical protein